ncbi:MAG: alanine--tRNA ligase, partial [Candidatus Latescibacteria bacterium]|nr:alanine--tRNA ligase [Candidatus Latescibacterota bacterium]
GEFVGYDMDFTEAELLRYRENKKGETELVFDKTPFYALSGGQVSDTGTIIPADESFLLRVTDVYDNSGIGRVHVCKAKRGSFSPDSIKTQHARLAIDAEVRRHTERNHSATHLLQTGLQKILGAHVRQSGSAVDSERLRFDFNHFSGMTDEEIETVEEFVNRAVIENYPITVRITSLEEARKIGAMSLFEEKYGEVVRLVKMGDVSLELCGGTHVSSTGCIGLFRIVSESSVAAGIRRIEAVTGMHAFKLARKEHTIISELSHNINAVPRKLVGRVNILVEKVRDLEKEIKRLRTRSAFGGDDILSQAVDVRGIRVAFGRMDVADTGELKALGDTVRDKIGSGVGVLGAAINGKVTIVVIVTDDLIEKHSLKAGDIVKKVAKIVGGSGGGRPHMAMAGGKYVSKLDEALNTTPAVIEELLGKSS